MLPGFRARRAVPEGEGEVADDDGGDRRSVHRLLDALLESLHHNDVHGDGAYRQASRSVDLLLWHG